MTPLPHTFTTTITTLYGAEGRRWLDGLPALLAACAARWSLTLLRPFPNLSYNYAAPATLPDGTAVVLKLGVPNPELTAEIAALTHWNGRGCVRLLAADAQQGILLLERLLPGHPLTHTLDTHSASDDQATRTAAHVMAALWQPPPPDHHFPHVADWAAGLQTLRRRYHGDSGPLPPRLLAAAESLFADLLPTMAAPVLLHGDLHHDNILAAGSDSWLAIDPKGVVGEPAYEAGALLRNPYPQVSTWPQLRQRQARRLDILAETLALDRQRLLAWGMAQAVLSAWWSLDDGGQVDAAWLVVAESLAALL